MSTLHEYIARHAERGACQCGRCIDGPPNPEAHQPTGHTADMVFFKVSQKDNPRADELRALITAHKGEFTECDLFDGNEHSYLEVGGWIGDQGFALTLMGLGSLLGLWKLLTPRVVLGSILTDEQVQKLAGQGYITIQAKTKEPAE